MLEVDVLLKVKLIHKSVRHFFSPDSLAVKTTLLLDLWPVNRMHLHPPWSKVPGLSPGTLIMHVYNWWQHGQTGRFVARS